MLKVALAVFAFLGICYTAYHYDVLIRLDMPSGLYKEAHKFCKERGGIYSVSGPYIGMGQYYDVICENGEKIQPHIK